MPRTIATPGSGRASTPRRSSRSGTARAAGRERRLEVRGEAPPLAQSVLRRGRRLAAAGRVGNGGCVAGGPRIAESDRAGTGRRARGRPSTGRPESARAAPASRRRSTSVSRGTRLRSRAGSRRRPPTPAGWPASLDPRSSSCSPRSRRARAGARGGSGRRRRPGPTASRSDRRRGRSRGVAGEVLELAEGLDARVAAADHHERERGSTSRGVLLGRRDVELRAQWFRR